MTDIFISYSRINKPWVNRLAECLEAEGYDVWWDTDMLPGQDFANIIRKELDETKCVITVWSPDSAQSPWVRSESNTALKHKKLIPILYQATELPMPFDHLHTEDFSQWSGDTQQANYQKLRQAIRFYTKQDASTTPPTKLNIEPKKKSKATLYGFLGVFIALVAAYFVWNNQQQKLREEKFSVIGNIVTQAGVNALASDSQKQNAVAQPETKRFIDRQDGTITDTHTKLMWKKCSEGLTGDDCSQGEATTYTWDDAVTHVKQVNFANHHDWQLPTNEQLATLIYCSNGSAIQQTLDSGCGIGGKDYQRPTIDQVAFPNTNNINFWATSLDESSGETKPWSVNFFNGLAVSSNPKNNNYRVRLVRSGM